MASSDSCSVDHSLITDKSFCTTCGEKIVQKSRTCINGHELAPKLKFCTECGEPAGVTQSAVAQPSRIPNIRIAPEEPNAKIYDSAGLGADSSPSYEYSAPNVSQKNNTGINSPMVRGAAAAIGVIIILIFAYAKISGNISTTDVTVDMVLVGQDCSSISWGYGDIPGGTVNLAVDGVNVASGSYSSYGTTVFNGCQFSATLSGVKENGSSYTVTSGNALRGSITDTKSELSANNWTFNLTLGGN
jgi:hypothetical protein